MREAPRGRAIARALATFGGLAVVGIATADVAKGSAAAPGSQGAAAGTPHLALRYRYELVDEAPFAADARASTLRLRLGYQTPARRGVSAFVELDHLAAVGGDAYDSTRNGLTGRPVIADPEDTDLNQAFLRIAVAKDELVLGRQRLNLDNQRFVGSVGWRQNEQTLDAVVLRARRLEGVTATYGYVANVNRVFGPERGVPPSDLRSNSHLVHAAWDLGAQGKLSAFGYALDFENAPALSSASFGALWSGRLERAGVGWLWSASYAHQRDYGDNPVDFDAPYWLLEGGVAHGAWTAKLGIEVLDGDETRSGRAFQTPLATLHAFQGWADRFLTTPPQGVEDAYITLAGKLAGTELQLAWHRYRAEAGSRDYGSEWNASIGRKLFGRAELLLKAARYEADGFARDTTKLWAMVSVAYP